MISLPGNTLEEAIIRREPLVWVGAKGGDAAQIRPLQLALSDPDTLDHIAAISELTNAGLPYRLAYASHSVAGLTAVVRSGQAIAVLTQTAVPDDLQILRGESGLPQLPDVSITLKLNSKKPSALVSAFEDHIRKVLPRVATDRKLTR